MTTRQYLWPKVDLLLYFPSQRGSTMSQKRNHQQTILPCLSDGKHGNVNGWLRADLCLCLLLLACVYVLSVSAFYFPSQHGLTMSPRKPEPVTASMAGLSHVQSR